MFGEICNRCGWDNPTDEAYCPYCMVELLYDYDNYDECSVRRRIRDEKDKPLDPAI